MVDLSNVALSELAAATGNVDFGGYKGVNVADPVANQDAATKKYHDDHKTSDAAEIVSGVFDDARIPAAIARDTEVASAVSDHAGLPSVHHTKYSDAEAVAAIEAVAELDLKLFTSAVMLRAWVYNSAAQTIPNNITTFLTWSNAEYNASPGTSPLWSLATNPSRFTCKYPGLYSVRGYARFAPDKTGRRIGLLRKNGTTSLIGFETAASATVYPSVAPEGIFQLAEDDYIEFGVHQNSGGNLDVSGGSYAAGFIAARLY